MGNNQQIALQGLAPERLQLTDRKALNSNLWQVAGIPLGNGRFWRYEDKNAVLDIGDDGVTIDIPRFSLSHDQVQIFDNPKYLVLTKSAFPPNERGVVAFSCRMKAEIKGGDPQDYRDGFAAFNVLDFNSAMVFDIISNGHRRWVIYERLLVPGMTTPEQAFTEVIPIEQPLGPNDEFECTIVYDRLRNSAKYYIDETLVHTANDVPVAIETLQTGFGLITLHPIANGKSTSCRGQGATGHWREFKVWR